MANPLDLWSDNRWLRNPLRDFSRRQDVFDRLFNEMLSLQQSGDLKMDFSPSCEVVEEDKNYLLKFDLPGVNKDQVKITIENDMLTVQAERKEEHKTDDKKKYVSEIAYGSYIRSFTLHEPIDEKQVDAKFENGVLSVRIPKIEKKAQSQAKQIAIH